MLPKLSTLRIRAPMSRSTGATGISGPEKQYLRYGEKLILTNSLYGVYLGCRGTEYQATYFAKLKRPNLSSLYFLYPNLDEIVFEIHPNLNYESLLEYNECSHNDPNKDIFYKRMILEQNLNVAKIEENRGKHVKLGSLVQLYHPNSRSYLCFESQNISGSEMGVLGSSAENSESVQFLITSPFDFLKEGSLVSYDEKFIFTDRYNKTMAFPVSESVLDKTRLKLEVKVSRGLLGFFDTSKPKEFRIPGILETQKLFEGYCAGYVNEKSIGNDFGNQFEAIPVESQYSNNESTLPGVTNPSKPKENDIIWGDSVSLRKVDSTGRYSLMFAEVNQTSYKDTVLYRTFSSDQAGKASNLESQFQLLSPNLKSSGSRIKFDKFGSTPVLLKHVLSGKFLSIDPQSQKLTLGGDFEEDYEKIKSNRSKLEKDYQDRYSLYTKLRESKKSEEISKRDGQNFTQREIEMFQIHGPSLFQTEDDYFLVYIMLRTFVLEKVSSDESSSLNNSTFVRIRTFEMKHLSVIQDTEYLKRQHTLSKEKEENDYFELTFYKQMDQKINHETIGQQIGGDIFHFEKTDKELLRRFYRLNSYTPFLCQVQCAQELKQSLTLQYTRVVESVTDIARALISLKKVSKYGVQMMMVQISVVDLLMQYLIKVRASTKESEEHMALLADSCDATLRLLSLVCDNNSTACAYIFQWRRFFTVSIIKTDNPVFKRINVDSLLFQIVDILKCYSIYIDDYLGALCSSMKAENQDEKKLGILLQITKNFQNLKDGVSVSRVFEKIFDPKYKEEIFRNLRAMDDDKSKIFFSLASGAIVDIDENLQENAQTYSYFLKILNLVVNLGELDPAKTAKHLQQVYPKDVCIALVTDPRFPSELRAMFLRLFALLYIIPHFHNGGRVAFEELVATQSQSNGDLVRQMSDATKALDKLRQTEENKSFLNSLLGNLSDSDNELALASLKVFNLLIDYQFFETDEILIIKNNFEEMILSNRDAQLLKEEEKNRRSDTQREALKGQDTLRLQRVVSEFDPRDVPVNGADKFQFQDPETLIEIVDMLIKLHRSLLRSKIVSLIKENRGKKSLESRPQKMHLAGNVSIDQLIKENFDATISGYLDKLASRNQQVWEVISHWALHKNPVLSAKVISFIHESSLMKYYFLEKYNEFHQVEDKEDELIYFRLRKYLRSISGKMQELIAEYTAVDYSTLRDQTDKLIEDLRDLTTFFYTIMEFNDRENKFELGVKELKFYKPKDISNLNSRPVWLNLLNIFLLDCQRLKSKQSIMLKSGLLDIVVNIAIGFNQQVFLQYPKLASERIHIQGLFKPLPEYATAEPLSDEINMMVCLSLYAGLVGNPTACSYIMEKYEAEFLQIMLSNLRGRNYILKKVTLTLLIEIYKDNLGNLLRLRQKTKTQFAELLKISQTELEKKGYSILINYIEFFEVLSHFNGAILEENAKDIFNSLFSDNLQGGTSITELINQGTIEDISSRYSSLAQAQKFDFSQTKRGAIFNQEHVDLDEMDEKNNIYFGFEVSDKLMFVSSLVGLIARFGRKGSLEFKSKMQKKLSMNSLIELIGAAKFHYYLKGQLVDLLNQVFITAKIDQNSKSYLLDLVSTVLLEDMKNYFKTKATNLNVKELYFLNKTARVNFICLDSSRKAPASNSHLCHESTQLFVDYCTQGVIPFVRKLGQILGTDSTSNLVVLETIMGAMEDAIYEKQLLLEIYDADKLMLSSIQGSRKAEYQRDPERVLAGSRYQMNTPSKSRNGKSADHRINRDGFGWSSGKKLKPRHKVNELLAPKTVFQDEFDNIEEFLSAFTAKLEELENFFLAEIPMNPHKIHELASINLLLLADNPILSKKLVEDGSGFSNLYQIAHLKAQLLRSHSSRVQGLSQTRPDKQASDHMQESEHFSSKTSNFFDELTTLVLFTGKTPNPKAKPQKNAYTEQQDREPRQLKLKIDKVEASPEDRQQQLGRSISNPISASNLPAAAIQSSHLTQPPHLGATPSAHSPAHTANDLPAAILQQPAVNPNTNAAVSQQQQKQQKPPLKKLDMDPNTLMRVVERKFQIIHGDKVKTSKKVLSLDAEEIKPHKDTRNFKEFVSQIVDSLQAAQLQTEVQQIMLAVEYLSYLLDFEVYRAIVIPVLESHQILRSLLFLISSVPKGSGMETVATLYSLVNKVLKYQTDSQQSFYEELTRDFENKIIGNYFATVETLFKGILELEAINTQVKSRGGFVSEEDQAHMEIRELVKSYIGSAVVAQSEPAETRRRGSYLQVPNSGSSMNLLKPKIVPAESIDLRRKPPLKIGYVLDVAEENPLKQQNEESHRKIVESHVMTSEQAQEEIYADAEQFYSLRHLLYLRNQAEVSFQISKYSELLVELLQLPQLLCLTHKPEMQDYLRVQTVNGIARPLQINVFEKLRDLMKGYLKIIKGRNLPIITNIITTLRHLLIGPCPENQKEMVVKKVSAVLEELYALLYQIQDPEYEADKSRAIISYLKLKLAMIEGTNDGLILKTLSISLNPELFWTRIEQIYCFLYNLTSTSSISKKHAVMALGGITESPTMSPVKKPQNKKAVIKNRFMEEIMQQVKATKRPRCEQFRTGMSNFWKKMCACFFAKKDTTEMKVFDGSKYSVYVQEALYTMIWMNQLSELVPQLSRKIDAGFEATKKTTKYLNKAAAFVRNKIRSIEVFGTSPEKLDTVYFYLPPIVGHLSHYSKRKFESEVVRKTAMTKLTGLMSWIELFYFEMQHFERLSQWGLKGNLSYITRLKIGSLILAVLVNLLMMIDSGIMTEEEVRLDRKGILSNENNTPIKRIVFIGSWALFILYLLIWTLWFFFEFSVKRQKFAKEADQKLKIELADYSKNARTIGGKFWKKPPFLVFKRQLRIWSSIIGRTNVMVIFFYVLMSFLSLVASRFFLSLLLLDAISLSPLLKNIVKSLALNYKALGGTAVLGVVLLFIYSSFTYFQKDFLITNLGVQDQPNLEFCGAFWVCFLDMITLGLRTGGGIGMALQYPDSLANINQYVVRTFFDLIFFVTIDLMLLNIVLGIIIDSFSELRDLKDLMGNFFSDQDNDKDNVCFICNLQREDFHDSSVSFNTHIAKTHNLWNYVYYIVSLVENAESDLNGIDAKLLKGFKEGDISWFPLHRTKLISQSQDGESQMKEKILRVEKQLDVVMGWVLNQTPEKVQKIWYQDSFKNFALNDGNNQLMVS